MSEKQTDHARGCQGREYTCTCGYDDQNSTLYSNAIARAEKAEEALRLVVAYDNLLLRYEGPSYTLFDGDVAEIDASYDKMVAAARAAFLTEGSK